MEVKDIFDKDLSSADCSVTERQTKELEDSFLKGVPFAYLLGKSEFFGKDFFINEKVLIPRPETEYMVDLIVKELKGKVNRVLDVGTGSGVILLSLLGNNVGKTGVGVDISKDALEVAEINSHRLKLDNLCRFTISDRLQNVEGEFDLIVSNPPYIRAQSHRHLVHNSVDTYEPKEALYLPDDFYTFWFEDFFQAIRSHLKGLFFMEGHELELDNQAEMLRRLGFRDVQVMNDLAGAKRFLRAKI